MRNLIRHMLLAFSAIFAGVLVVTGAPDPAAAATATAAEAQREAQAQQEQAHAEALATKARCCHITIPGSYVYAPNTNHQRTLHDYCSYSPDEYHTVGRNADFRGPCSRHDLCYQHRQRSQSGCDIQFYRHLLQECTYTYAWYDPRRSGCIRTATVYYAAVAAHTLWPW